jgi:hypothetical protein
MRRKVVHDAAGDSRNSLLLSLAAGLALASLAPGTARADTPVPLYNSERIVQSGGATGSATLPANYNLYVGGLSDSGQIIFSAGWQNQGTSERLYQYAGGKFTPIVMAASGPAADWPGDVYWPKDVTISRPVNVNKSGNAAFAVSRVFGTSPYGTFLWNAATGHTTPAALKDMPATGDLTFVSPAGYSPAINSSDEIAIVGMVKNAAGTRAWGLFRLGRDGVMEPVARPHEELPGGARISIDQFPMPSIDDSGRVAFIAHPDGSGRRNAYLWVHDQVTPILTYGSRGMDGGKVVAVQAVLLNSQNPSALVVAATDAAGGSRYGLFRVQNGTSIPVALPRQTMPGGGKLQTVQYLTASDESQVPSVAVSTANALGEHVFLATLEDGTPAAYKIDKNGGLHLVLKGEFTSQPVVHITAALPPLKFVPGSRPSINSRGQIALAVRRTGSPDMIVLMTPQGS